MKEAFTEEEITTVRRIAHNCYADGWPDDNATLNHIADKMAEAGRAPLPPEIREALERLQTEIEAAPQTCLDGQTILAGIPRDEWRATLRSFLSVSTEGLE